MSPEYAVPRQLASLALTGALLWGCGNPSPNDAGDVIAMTETGPVGIDAADVRDVTTPLDVAADESSPDDSSTGNDAVADASACTSGGAYPAGPYGTMVGQTVPNLMWRGLVMPAGSMTPSTGAAPRLTLQDLRAQGCRFAVLHVTTPG